MKDSLEVVAAAFNQMLLFLSHSDGKEDTIIEIMNGGDGPDRADEDPTPEVPSPAAQPLRSFVRCTSPSARIKSRP